MKILVVGINYAPEEAGIAVYTSGLAEDLVRRGDEVTVICAPPHFPLWQIREGYRADRYQTSVKNGVKVVRCPTFIPNSTKILRRLLHYLSFSLSSLPVAVLEAKRFQPDVVFCVAPALLSAPVALLAAKVAGARSWLHVQDLEIEAAFATGVLGEGLLARCARKTESILLRGFDHISTISTQMLMNIADKGISPQRLSEFPNWSDLREISPLRRPSSYRQQWGIWAEHVALYAGSIGNKQGVELIIEAARLLRHRDDLIFVICGEGPNRPRLEALAGGLSNVRFYDLQPRTDLNELLGLASVHLITQLADAADNVLPSKLANMMASGKPIVATASPGTGLHDRVATCGLISRPGDAEDFAGCITRLLDDERAREQLGKRARHQAEESLDFDRIITFLRGKLIALTPGVN